MSESEDIDADYMESYSGSMAYDGRLGMKHINMKYAISSREKL